MSDLDRLEPREVWTLRDGDALRWSRTAELVGWAVWMICSCIPFAEVPGVWQAFMQRYRPPGFIPPNKR